MPDLGLTSNFDVIEQKLSLRGKFVIDAGCGDMSLSRHLAEQGASVLAIDPDPVQARLNQQAETIPNVGFAETTADALPVEPGSVDGVIFSYSLHHIPKSAYPAVFNEVLRVLKPSGFLYVMEPVAAGEYNDIMSLFHDEKQVRADAQAALDQWVRPHFKVVEDFTYHVSADYKSWDQFADKFVGLSYNANYTEEQVRAPAVRERFEALGAPLNYTFNCPVQVSYFQGINDPELS